MLAAWLVVILGVIGGSALYDRYKTSEYDASAETYIKDVIPAISQWDPAATKALMASEVAETISAEQFAQTMNLFSRLGSLQSMNEPQFIDVHNGTQGALGELTIVEYDVDAEYANGDATINLKLLFREDLFEIYNFNIRSETLGK